MGGRCRGAPAGRQRAAGSFGPAPLPGRRMAARQDTALSVSGGRTGADEESAASAKRRKERTAGHRAVSVLLALSGAARGRQAEDAPAAAAPPAGMRSGLVGL
ncbi:hypothetical protein M7775_13210 [Sporomusa sphaeroides DSM 2875]|uniref:hypothetical protein n=1 Tax=Sporomusa sphaeroides TaxID=47679 RepID=UPI002030492A|nr:hypothetical protein [Sporomusa sphaeroides]MCM0759511.1 hypothetical protein [Sporomusa sphaeroides DSM 2875]